MPKSPIETGPGTDLESRPKAALDRRSFLASGAAVVAIAEAPAAQAAETIAWDREADVVVIGAGAGGLVAAIAAREKGASVLIVEKNFDTGGRAMMSFGGLYIWAAAIACRGRTASMTLLIGNLQTGHAQKSRSAASAIERWCAPGPTTISNCSIGWRSTGSNGTHTVALPIV
jgi:hypothetical protein